MQSKMTTRRVMCALLVMCMAGCFKSRPYDVTSRDRNHLSNIADAIVIYQLDNGPLRLAQATESEAQYLSVVLGLLKGNGNERLAYLSSGNTAIDRWGNGYHLHLDADGDGRITVGTQAWAASVVMWSDGPNMKDEKGAGDDVVVTSPPKPLTPRPES